ncbi:Ribonuclease YqcG [Bacillus subtilis]|nr:Ribonuclease YqcG [Bacillus subtilis]CAF1898620.1 Ribonuclease YqcG [Bacillus subtilis]CAF1915162.1 Ribonuclease YqcG [Bacillus subtilis]
MAAAGYIPIVGWAGKLAKGGKAVYSTSKAIYRADKALDIYKHSLPFKTPVKDYTVLRQRMVLVKQ